MTESRLQVPCLEDIDAIYVESVSTCLIAKRCRYSSAELCLVLNCSRLLFSIPEHNDRMPVSDVVQIIVAAT